MILKEKIKVIESIVSEIESRKTRTVVQDYKDRLMMASIGNDLKKFLDEDDSDKIKSLMMNISMRMLKLFVERDYNN